MFYKLFILSYILKNKSEWNNKFKWRNGILKPSEEGDSFKELDNDECDDDDDDDDDDNDDEDEHENGVWHEDGIMSMIMILFLFFSSFNLIFK